MYATLDANMQKLANLIKNIVNNMNPTVICMCEVGEVKHPLDSGQMQKVADAAILAWKVAATEHIQLCSMFAKGAPYLTVYIDGPIQCSKHRILRDLYTTAHGEPRTAQTFVCTLPSGDSMDVLNVHAASGTGNKRRLRDLQRQQLVTDLLQSSSQASATAGANLATLATRTS